jgi:ATP-dependent RNA helicase RhlE
MRPLANCPPARTSTNYVSFASLGLKEPILRGVRAAGYDTPTEIQAHAIPKILAGAELIGLGQTGSGKTAAFGLPMLDKLCGGEPGLRGVIIVPTRELCVQVAENLRVYAQFAGLHVCTAFGGVDMSIQESAFKRGLDVVVACPGRLIDHLERRNISLERVQMVVLDEADRMLDMGFMPQIRRIFVRLPQERQNLLFSATMPTEKASSATSCRTPSACRSASAASRRRPSRTDSSPAPSPTSNARWSACWSAKAAAC